MRSATNALSHYVIIIYQTCGESERLRGERLTTAILASLVFPYRLDFPTDWDFPDSSVGKESACSAGDPSSIPGSGRPRGEGIGDPLQYSGLKNSMECMVHRAAKSQT